MTDELGNPGQQAPPAQPPAPGAGPPATGPGAAPPRRASGAVRKTVLTTWETIWYVLGCIWFGASYLTKVPAKKAMQDFGLCQMTSAEQAWYIVLCIWFGMGYFAKIPTAVAGGTGTEVPVPGPVELPLGTPFIPF
ncbi:MAG: hypothetical protein M0020_03065 [Actinomycetota bacterium]|nr:hypothetical protein [Actinomycetota bacterium]